MNILGLDTSSVRDCSLGFYFSDKEKMGLLLRDEASQEEKLLTAIDRGLELMGHEISEIDCIAVGTGPGSFTGLRIGLSVARGLAWAGEKKIMGFSSLELVARTLPPQLIKPDSLIVPVMDAKMKKVYSASFSADDNGLLERIGPDSDLSPEELVEKLKNTDFKDITLIGNGIVRYGEVFNNLREKKIIKIPDYPISGLTICRMPLEYPDSAVKGLDKVFPAYLRKSEAENQLEIKKTKGTE